MREEKEFKGGIVKIENITVLTLDERDVRLSATNGGLSADLPPKTTKVIIRVNAKLEEEEGRP
jgi:hypothetical protein